MSTTIAEFELQKLQETKDRKFVQGFVSLCEFWGGKSYRMCIQLTHVNGFLQLTKEDALKCAELLRQWASVCKTCNGRGEIGGHSGQTAESFEYDSEPCPDCNPKGKLGLA